MNPDTRIYVAGHRGLVGSALVRRLVAGGYANLVTRTHAELDLADAAAVDRFFAEQRPAVVFLAAAKVGGIQANATRPAEFIRDNLAIQLNAIDAAYRHGVARLLFLGSSCIYPRDCPQPMREEYLLTGPLEATNRPYAIAKIAGIEQCSAYNRQYGTRYLAVMPTNLYGPGDNYDLESSHVLPALIRKMHEAKQTGAPSVTVWGSGTPRRELLYSDDLADACVHLANLPDADYDALLNVAAAGGQGGQGGATGADGPATTQTPARDALPALAFPLVNVGTGEDLTIRELAERVREVVGYRGELVQDPAKPDGTPRKRLDIRRIAATGWRAKTGLREGIGLAYRDFLGASGRVHRDR